MKYFNTDGPCNETEHYMIDVSMRLKDAEMLIDSGQYLVAHASPQCGKTTYLRDRANRLNVGGRCFALYCSLKDIGKRIEPAEAVPEIIRTMRRAFASSGIFLGFEFAPRPDYRNFAGVLNIELTSLCMKANRPVIIFFDDVDMLSDSALIFFLRQLRDGYNNRRVVPFLHSVVLSGMRNIRDYKARLRPYRESLGSTSPFNIVAETQCMNNFIREEIVSLYGQHTKETGQPFDPSAIDRVYELTRGHPWMVNAIASVIVNDTLRFDPSLPVTVGHVDNAVSAILLRRDTLRISTVHIDRMIEHLKEDRLRQVVKSILTGTKSKVRKFSDEYLYAFDLGLIRHERGKAVISCPIYEEIIARALSVDLRSTDEKVKC
jgi:hypothetical protein